MAFIYHFKRNVLHNVIADYFKKTCSLQSYSHPFKKYIYVYIEMNNFKIYSFFPFVFNPSSVLLLITRCSVLKICRRHPQISLSLLSLSLHIVHNSKILKLLALQRLVSLRRDTEKIAKNHCLIRAKGEKNIFFIKKYIYNFSFFF